MPREDRCQCRVIHEERIAGARETALDKRETGLLAQLFKAMADLTRLKIIMALAQDEMCVCDLAAFLGVSESAVSHQLRMLRQLQLVSNRREGPVLYYRLADHHVSKLIEFALEHIRE